MRRVIFNEKGGVGKSSITCNLAAISAQQGKRTLVVDLDPQCNSSCYLLGEYNFNPSQTIAGYFQQVLDVFPRGDTSCIHETSFENLDVIPSSPELLDIQHKLESRYKIYKLKELLDSLESEYDQVFIDTAPASNFYTRSALISAHNCLIPFDCDAFSRQALYNVMAVINEIREDHNSELQVEGIIPNQYQPRAKLPNQLIEELLNEELPITETRLGHSVKMRESHQTNKPLIYMAPSHNLTLQFKALHDELCGIPATTTETK